MQGVEEHVILQRLPSNLGLFAYTFLRRALNLGQPSDRNGKPNVAEVNNVLRRHLCADQRGNHIFTFGTLELENEKCVGIQRIRCRPFTFDKWYGTNPRQYVALIPPTNYSKIKFADFDITIKEHRDKIWFGRVELLFRCSFRVSDSDPEPPEEEGEILQCDLALISCLYDFKYPLARNSMQTMAGASLLYEPNIPWTVVMPINHILGRVPLMRTYLEGSSASTIPFSLSRYKDRYFKYGTADQRGSEGTGSRLFELNVHIWRFARPQPRTMSVSERFAAAEARKTAANAKGAETRGLKRPRDAATVPE